jgi:hypothetical protein
MLAGKQDDRAIHGQDKVVVTSSQKRVAREELIKKNGKPTQNWCCQSFLTEGYTKEKVQGLMDCDVQ